MKQRLLYILIILQVILIASAGYVATIEAFSFLPRDLLYNGKPIDPACITSTQFTGSGITEPKLVNCVNNPLTEGVYYWGLNADKEISRKILIDEERQLIELQSEVQFDGEPDRIFKHSESYQYIDTYRGLHLVLVESDTMGGTGYFSSLAFLKRVTGEDGNDYLQNVFTFHFGDRANGGIQNIDYLKGDFLQYKCYGTPSDLVMYLDQDDPQSLPIKEQLEHLSSGASGYAFRAIIRVDLKASLDDPDQYVIREVVGMALLENHWLDQDWYEREDNQTGKDFCFSQMALQYLHASHIELTMDEARMFAQEVGQCIKMNETKGTLAGQ